MEPNFYAQNEMIWASLKTIKLKKKKLIEGMKLPAFMIPNLYPKKID